MIQNLLVQRMKAAKREITALKTAHQRGLNLKVFSEERYFTNSEIGFYDGVITVTFDQGFAAYPFAYVLGHTLNPDQMEFYSVRVDSVVYRDNGYTMDFIGSFVYYPEDITNRFSVYSTSPITSISYRWT